MAALQTDARLFGLDLSGLGTQWLQAIRAMGQWPLVSWLTPRLPVRVLMPHGDVLTSTSDQKPLALQQKANIATEFEAVVLPDDLVLHHQVQLPPLPAAETQAALALAVQSQSPFAPDDLLWVARPAGTAHATTATRDVVLTSRPLVQAYLDTARPRLLKATAPNTPPEIWAHVAGAPPFVVPGFGEARRQRSTRRRFAVNIGLCLLAFGLAVAAAVTPTLQLRMRAIDAVAQHARLQQQVAPALALRESHIKTTEQLQALADVAGPPVSAVQVLDLVTRALPDDTSLLSFVLNATEAPAKPPKVVLTGNTGNAAALMQKLGNQPGLRDIKALTAATKPLGADKESFSIEATLDLANLKP
jgi:general secretion pathway protein L